VYQGRGVKAGVSLNPATPLCSLDYILSDIELVLYNVVNPGSEGESSFLGIGEDQKM